MKKSEYRKHSKLTTIIPVFSVIIILALVIEASIAWGLARKSADRSTTMLLNHIETILNNNEKDEQQQTEELKENYISYAQTIAYIISAKPEIIYDRYELQKIAEYQHVDEIHIFNDEGKIIAGTVPEYYGFSFNSGEQMAYFKPMLEDKTLTMCQDVTPNTAEGKSMMYAIVWNEEGTRMVQVGIEPKRLLTELQENSIENVVDNIPLSDGFAIYAIDSESMEIAAGTDDSMLNTSILKDCISAIDSTETHSGRGMVGSTWNRYYCNYKPVGDYIIVTTYSMNSSLNNILVPMDVIAVFLILAGIVIYYLFARVYESEEKLKNTVLHLEEDEDIICAAGHGIWRFLLDSGGHICGMIVNDQWKRIFGAEDSGLSPTECLQYFLDGLVNKDESPARFDYSDMDSKSVIQTTFAWNHPQKGVIYIEVGGARHVAANGEIQISGYASEVTEQTTARQKWEEELIKAKEAAEAANSAKTSFLFNMSHDIRTPMNAIIGYANLMKKNEDNREKCRDYLDKILFSSDFLLDLINNVLEMARIDSGKMALDESPESIMEFYHSVCAVFEEEMKKKGIEYFISIDIQHETLFYDSVKLKEIFLNIISNALKYTPSGGSVRVEILELSPDTDGYALIQTRVTDTGIGMSEDYLPHLFEEFTRERTSTENKVQGTGLGMPIVKKLVDMMGGTISVESELGKGTVFTVTLRHKTADSDSLKNISAPADERIDLTGRRILLAEDNDLNAEIAMEILKEVGVETDRAEDGIVCVHKLEQSPAGYYDLILMDIQMPNMDGYKAARVIRHLPDKEKAAIPIIAMTANAFEEDRQNALSAGMNGHLAKPIEIPRLMETLAAILK